MDQVRELEAMLEEFETTDQNPCGGSVYYDEGEGDESAPWRVHYCDGCCDENFPTYREAACAIRAYVEDMRLECGGGG